MDARSRAHLANVRKRRDELLRYANTKAAELKEPIDYRKAHSPVDGEPVIIGAEAGADTKRGKRNNAHTRIQDSLDALHRNGTIARHAGEKADEWYAAGRRFQGDFTRAGFVGIKACNWEATRVDGMQSGLPAGTEARDHVWWCLYRLGGLTSPPARAAWAILGEGMTIKDYAEMHGMNQHEAKGFFVACLPVLASYYSEQR